MQVFDGGRPLISSSFRLHLARWTHFFHLVWATLSQVVDVELRGIQAHAWDVETAAFLLDEWCLITEVDQDAGARRDVLRVCAWCSRPDLIPRAMNLLIEKPQVAVDDGLVAVRALSYMIKISALATPSSSTSAPPPLPSAAGGRRRRRRRRRHAHHGDASLPGPCDGPGSTIGDSLAPVHSCLGPRTQSAAPTERWPQRALFLHWLVTVR